MRITTDDEVYQVNSVWLGPPGATMPFKARYVSWGIGIVACTFTFAAARMWFALGFFTLAWSLVIGVVVTRTISKKITHERPFTQVLVMFVRELSTPRRRTRVIGGAAAAGAVRTADQRPRPLPTSASPAQPITEQPLPGSAATREAPHA